MKFPSGDGGCPEPRVSFTIGPSKIQKPDQKPDYHTIASINARIDAAMRAAVPGWQPPAIPGLRKASPLPNPAGGELIQGNAQRPGQP